VFPQSFNRSFELWRYFVGHAQLLLRSTKSEEHGTRIDVGFKNVRYVQLPTSMGSLSIEIGADSDLPDDVQQALDTAGMTIFLVTTDIGHGFVVAGYGGWREDDGEYYEPSGVLPDIA